MRRIALLLVCLAAASAVGWLIRSGGEPAAGPQLSSSGGPVEPANESHGPLADSEASPLWPPTVRLMDPGAEPRAALRLRVARGQRERVSLEIIMTNPPKVQGSRLEVEFIMEAREIDGEQDIVFAAALESFDFASANTPERPPNKAMEGALATLKGTSLTGVVTSCGAATGLQLKYADGALPHLVQLFERASGQLTDFGPPLLPEEPVGPGARWEVAMPMMLTHGATQSGVAAYTLKSNAGGKLELDFVLTGSVDQTPLREPEPSAGSRGAKSEPPSRVVGSLTHDLSRLVPIRFEVTGYATGSGGQTPTEGGGEGTVEIRFKRTITGALEPRAGPK